MASRWPLRLAAAAFVSRSTSALVRYSRQLREEVYLVTCVPSKHGVVTKTLSVVAYLLREH